ncbi:PalH-domain-containing protein [Xylona heveae TC161]|uniref:PalH-domain-containing protein n=1 Tax=Xylona heveae (strain CBS 132557 / TC161) TaxID=1328760 RepID=A0A165K335_XYLHT|nr:PalH-domain-containing protein [Xylona heveae TC161]KZF26931.1 PalH-domain-containing protein [Xylona heveae TC161]
MTASQHCTPFALPSNGILSIDESTTITLTRNAVFEPRCTGANMATEPPSSSDPSTVADLRDPFYASTFPQAYAISAATVVSWMLVIALCITPRSFLYGSSSSSRRLLGGRGIISGASGGTPVVGLGIRPWFQTVAALTVAISLTIASADSFNVAKKQYILGFMDADRLRDRVANGLEIRVVRVISDLFVWLAQVQTLIRLFPRHKEKVVIKWTGIALIVLDTIFSILNSFVIETGRTRPRDFDDAIPALNYLLALALSFLYAACVVYYALSKRRFAFYHPRMWNMPLVALLSICAIFVPVVFFVLDISKPDLGSWGDYVRWVGAAAASVIVWEWVERIEALERDERKDGILGREIFDGDEMLEITPSEEVSRPGPRRGGQGGDHGGMPVQRPEPANTSTSRRGMSSLAFRVGRSHQRRDNRESGGEAAARDNGVVAHGSGRHPASYPHPSQIPSTSTTPLSAVESLSATSTVYAVHYHSVSDSTPPIPEETAIHPRSLEDGNPMLANREPKTPSSEDASSSTTHDRDDGVDPSRPDREARWHKVINPFKRKRASPPPEVASGMVVDRRLSVGSSTSVQDESTPAGGVLSRFGFPTRAQRIRHSRTTTPLPLTIIPAQPRGRPWSPGSSQEPAQVMPDEEASPVQPPQTGVSSRATQGKAVNHELLNGQNTNGTSARFLSPPSGYSSSRHPPTPFQMPPSRDRPQSISFVPQIPPSHETRSRAFDLSSDNSESPPLSSSQRNTADAALTSSSAEGAVLTSAPGDGKLTDTVHPPPGGCA